MRQSLVRFLTVILRPGRFVEFLAGTLTLLLRIIGPRRAEAKKNLAIVMPTATRQEINATLRASYRHLAWVALETIMAVHDPSLVRRWFEVTGEDILADLGDKGAILLACHVGNWELAASWVSTSGINRVTSIVRDSDDAAERGLISDMRKTLGINCMSKKAPMKRVISLLRNGEFVGILPDQHGGREGIRVPLFGRETSTSQGAAVFAYLTGAPLVPAFTHRTGPYRHVIRFEKPLVWQRGEDREETVRNITSLINRTVERMISEAPSQWLAQHRRFRD